MDTIASFVGGGLFAIAAGLLLWKGHALFKRLPARQHRQFAEDLQMDAEALIRAELHVAELQAQLARKIGEMPAEFSAPALLAVRMGYAVEKAVLAEAVRRGLVSGAVVADLTAPAENDAPREEPPPAPRGSDKGRPLTEWADGVLVPFRRGR